MCSTICSMWPRENTNCNISISFFAALTNEEIASLKTKQQINNKRKCSAALYPQNTTVGTVWCYLGDSLLSASRLHREASVHKFTVDRHGGTLRNKHLQNTVWEGQRPTPGRDHWQQAHWFPIEGWKWITGNIWWWDCCLPGFTHWGDVLFVFLDEWKIERMSRPCSMFTSTLCVYNNSPPANNCIYCEVAAGVNTYFLLHLLGLIGSWKSFSLCLA